MTAQLPLLRDLFTLTFGTPEHHPKSKPFIDHVLSFMLVDNKIWMRHYQVATAPSGALVLTEIGPRLVLTPIKVFAGSFGGATLFENPHYMTPSVQRRALKMAAELKYAKRQVAKEERELKSSFNRVVNTDEVDNLFVR